MDYPFEYLVLPPGEESPVRFYTKTPVAIGEVLRLDFVRKTRRCRGMKVRVTQIVRALQEGEPETDLCYSHSPELFVERVDFSFGPCSFLTCLETGAHLHPVCPKCETIRYGNSSNCDLCKAHREREKGRAPSR